MHVVLWLVAGKPDGAERQLLSRGRQASSAVLKRFGMVAS
jgi:hypothetical protein